jgi:hypothetical protein
MMSHLKDRRRINEKLAEVLELLCLWSDSAHFVVGIVLLDLSC